MIVRQLKATALWALASLLMSSHATAMTPLTDSMAKDCIENVRVQGWDDMTQFHYNNHCGFPVYIAMVTVTEFDVSCTALGIAGHGRHGVMQDRQLRWGDFKYGTDHYFPELAWEDCDWAMQTHSNGDYSCNQGSYVCSGRRR